NGRSAATSACAPDRGAALQEQAADQGERPSARAHAGAAQVLWLDRGHGPRRQPAARPLTAAAQRGRQQLAARRASVASLVNRRLHALRREAILLVAAELAVGDLGENLARRRQCRTF